MYLNEVFNKILGNMSEMRGLKRFKHLFILSGSN